MTPTDEWQALEAIAEALNIYLHMSASSETSLITTESDAGLMLLKANISHLQSQLMLFQATLQAKDATIFMQQTSIENLKFLLSNAASAVSHEEKPKTSEDKEEILGGLAAITNYTQQKEALNCALPKHTGE